MSVALKFQPLTDLIDSIDNMMKNLDYSRSPTKPSNIEKSLYKKIATPLEQTVLRRD